MGTQSVDAALDRLDRRKRRAYVLVIVLVGAVTAGNWVIAEPGDAFLIYVYPAMIAFLLACVPFLLNPRIPASRLAPVLLGTATAVVLTRLVDMLYRSESLEARLLDLTGAQYWALGALLLLTLLVFDRRRGARVAGGLVALSLALALGAIALEAARGGPVAEATEYLLRVHGFLGISLVIVVASLGFREELHRATERAEGYRTQALTDHLTGLASRQAATGRLREELADAARRGRPLAVALLDVDRFKDLNDAHGHEAGDVALVALAGGLEETVRARDLAARWGGEEFLLVLPETDLAAAVAVAERCREALARLPLDTGPVTATFGVTTWDGEESVDRLIGRADRALYRGKADGRDRVVSLEPAAPAGVARGTGRC